ncbi:hypothetical protein FA15DRAFT_282978 [Coprinopsis marcescibilis]|uniref:Uncharacterized protein n=1 Tax=Coprinopsis marcescibilis TaxID=230819 RepID=A0A5C3L9B4_COPMA|nr:hypothetical protein FA15DRAFT_282978 [Coprinopsis marcescibilis]
MKLFHLTASTASIHSLSRRTTSAVLFIPLRWPSFPLRPLVVVIFNVTAGSESDERATDNVLDRWTVYWCRWLGSSCPKLSTVECTPQR